MIERLVLVSLTESIPLNTDVQRRGRKTPPEFERVISLLEKHFGAMGPVHIAGRERSAVCTGSLSPEASTGGVKRCSGRIALSGDQERALPGTEIRFDAHRGRGREPGSLTLTCNPSRLLTGTDRHPTLKRGNGKPYLYPSTSNAVTQSLSEFPFEILAAINSNAYLVDPKKIRIRRMEWTASVPCSDPKGLLEVLAIAFGLVINDNGAVLQLARHLGLWVKYDVDQATNQMKWVSFEKRQGRRRLFAIRFCVEGGGASPASNSVRVAIVAHDDGLASIVSAARRRAKRFDCDQVRMASRDINDAKRNTAWQLSAAFWVLGCRRSDGQIKRRSLADWLIPYLLCDVLRLNVIGNLNRQGLRRLSNLEDKVGGEWVAMRADPDKNYAAAIAEATGLSDQTVYERRKRWLEEYGVDIAIPHRVYADLLALGSLSAAQSEQRAALLAADIGADAEAIVRTLRNALTEFDRRRSIIGEIAGARPSQVEVMTVDPSFEAKLLLESRGEPARAGHVRNRKLRSERSGGSGSRRASQTKRRSVKSKGASRGDQSKGATRRRRAQRRR